MFALCAHRKALVTGNACIGTCSSNNDTSYPCLLQRGTLLSQTLN